MVVPDDFRCSNMVVPDDFGGNNMVVPDDFWGSNTVLTYDIMRTQGLSLCHESSLSLSESSQCRQFQSRESQEFFQSSLCQNFNAKMAYYFASCLSCWPWWQPNTWNSTTNRISFKRNSVFCVLSPAYHHLLVDCCIWQVSWLFCSFFMLWYDRLTFIFGSV